MTWTVRDATQADAAACAAIYAPYVAETVVSFETEAPGPDEMARRIATAQSRHAWLVLEGDGAVVGYAYGGPFRARTAWQWSCEVSVYVERSRRGGGRGRALYEVLLQRLADRGYRTAVAVMTQPNEASAGLHRGMGFEEVGVHPRIGWKFGQWHDVAFAQRAIGPLDGPPAELR